MEYENFDNEEYYYYSDDEDLEEDDKIEDYKPDIIKENEDCFISLEDPENIQKTYEINDEELIKETIDCNIKKIPKVAPINLTKDHINPTNALDALLLIMTPELLHFIAEQTNNNAREKLVIDFKTDGEEILNYLTVFIYLSVIDLPEIDMLWKKSEYYTTVMPRVISMSRFKEINRYFIIYENINSEKDKVYGSIHKIKKVVDYFNLKWKEIYNYSPYMTVDECMAAYKGRIPHKMLIRSKTKSQGMKFFAKANSLNGYMYTVTPYPGKEYEYDKDVGCGPTALIALIEDHKNSNTHFTWDNWYSSIGIFNYCHLNKIYFTCTWLQSRRGYPELLKKIKLKKPEKECYRVNNTDIRYYIFYDMKQVHMATNKYTANTVEYLNLNKERKVKPELVAYYNFFRCGVDMVDSICSVYSSKRNTNSWWKSVFWYLFDISIHNASIIFYDRNSKQKSKMLKFRRGIYESRFQKYLFPRELKSEDVIYSIANDRNKEIHTPVKSKFNRKCVECLKEKFNNPFIKNVTNSIWICSICNVNLCYACFGDYHSFKSV